MNATNSLFKEVAALLIAEQRSLTTMLRVRDDYPNSTDIIDPMIARLRELCNLIAERNDELRMIAVASRT